MQHFTNATNGGHATLLWAVAWLYTEMYPNRVVRHQQVFENLRHNLCEYWIFCSSRWPQTIWNRTHYVECYKRTNHCSISIHSVAYIKHIYIHIIFNGPSHCSLRIVLDVWNSCAGTWTNAAWAMRLDLFILFTDEAFFSCLRDLKSTLCSSVDPRQLTKYAPVCCPTSVLREGMGGYYWKLFNRAISLITLTKYPELMYFSGGGTAGITWHCCHVCSACNVIPARWGSR